VKRIWPKLLYYTYKKFPIVHIEKIVLNGYIVIVKFEWSKTIQFCPVTAFKYMCEMLPASEHSPAFVFPKGSGVVPVTYNVYNRYIKYFLNWRPIICPSKKALNKFYMRHSPNLRESE
jgi:hypothetical protein